jgi:hypothetical protein
VLDSCGIFNPPRRPEQHRLNRQARDLTGLGDDYLELTESRLAGRVVEWPNASPAPMCAGRSRSSHQLPSLSTRGSLGDAAADSLCDRRLVLPGHAQTLRVICRRARSYRMARARLAWAVDCRSTAVMPSIRPSASKGREEFQHSFASWILTPHERHIGLQVTIACRADMDNWHRCNHVGQTAGNGHAAGQLGYFRHSGGLLSQLPGGRTCAT